MRKRVQPLARLLETHEFEQLHRPFPGDDRLEAKEPQGRDTAPGDRRPRPGGGRLLVQRHQPHLRRRQVDRRSAPVLPARDVAGSPLHQRPVPERLQVEDDGSERRDLRGRQAHPGRRLAVGAGDDDAGIAAHERTGTAPGERPRASGDPRLPGDFRAPGLHPRAGRCAHRFAQSGAEGRASRGQVPRLGAVDRRQGAHLRSHRARRTGSRAGGRARRGPPALVALRVRGGHRTRAASRRRRRARRPRRHDLRRRVRPGRRQRPDRVGRRHGSAAPAAYARAVARRGGGPLPTLRSRTDGQRRAPGAGADQTRPRREGGRGSSSVTRAVRRQRRPATTGRPAPPRTQTANRAR